MTVLAFIVILGALILVHELGHFWAAKRAGIKVEEFGLGYPPRLLTLGHWGETEYTLNAIPFGGFVRMAGEEDPDIPRSLASKSKRVRLVVLGAGAAVNLLLAFALFWATFLLGVPVPVEFNGVSILNVASDSPAEAAGLRRGDLILAVDGSSVQSPQKLTDYIHQHLGEEIRLKVQRGEETLNVPVVPRQKWPENQGPVGVVIQPRASKTEIHAYPWWQALWLGLRQTLSTILLTLYVPVLVLRGLMPAKAIRPVGPVGIAQMAGNAARRVVSTGWWFPLLQLTATISAGLCLANLLPLPGLDGGRILFVILEAIRGRRISPEKEGIIHLIGMALLIILMLIITYHDIASPVPSINWGEFF
ncbi:MAG: M50 family metallopeptidase [Chloroflexota bacterium]|nr:M50 family metallopeptidase [Chloroflexota bacterium]